MEDIKNIQSRIMELLKHISLRQISKRSGLNYLTLHNIKSGKSKKVTPRVAKRFAQFERAFLKTMDKVGAEKQAAVEGPAKETRKTPVAKARKAVRRTRKPVVQGAKPQKQSPPRKRGRKPAAPAPETPAVVKSAPASSPVPVLFGDKLNDEIAALEIRLSYLRAMQKAETEYLRALGRIKH